MITQDIIIRSNTQVLNTHWSPFVHLVYHPLETGCIDREVFVLQRAWGKSVGLGVSVQDAEVQGQCLGIGVGGGLVEEEAEGVETFEEECWDTGNATN